MTGKPTIADAFRVFERFLREDFKLLQAAAARSPSGPTPFAAAAWPQRWSVPSTGSRSPQEGHRLIRYDARGHGRSGGRPNPSDYAFENLARDLLALIDVLSPDAPVAGIGLSLGTATLFHAAVIAPDRFEKLVLTAPPTAWETRAPPEQALCVDGQAR